LSQICQANFVYFAQLLDCLSILDGYIVYINAHKKAANLRLRPPFPARAFVTYVTVNSRYFENYFPLTQCSSINIYLAGLTKFEFSWEFCPLQGASFVYFTQKLYLIFVGKDIALAFFICYTRLQQGMAFRTAKSTPCKYIGKSVKKR
jgi:hypothetical protein